MSVLTIVAVIAILAYVIGRQLLGEPLRGKRLIILPLVLTGVGVLDLTKHSVHPGGTDILLIVIGAVIAGAVGLALGQMMRLEERNGGLWGQLPLQGLGLWVLLYASRGALIAIACACGAHVAAGAESELLILGVNRLGQAVSVGARALTAGIPFTPESDGSEPLGASFGRMTPSDHAGTRQGDIARRISSIAADVVNARMDERRSGRGGRRGGRRRERR